MGAVAPSLVGRVLAGRYRIVRRLGAGGMGTVYEALEEGLKRRVAVKVLHPDRAHEPRFLARFRQEAEAAARLTHPCIVQVSDFQAPANELPFLVMEYVEGRTLHQLVHEAGPLDLARVARIASQILEGLGAAHERGIIHRDIKPDNVILVPSATHGDLVKVLDFGIAKVERDTTSAEGPKTAWGDVLGTLRYMPPEQARGDVVDARADLYAVAGCMYFATSGKPPITSKEQGAVIRAILFDEPTPLSQFRRDVDPMFEAIVKRGLAKVANERFATARSMRAAIVAWLDADATREDAPDTIADVAPAPAWAPPVQAPRRENPWSPVLLVVALFGASVVASVMSFAWICVFLVILDEIGVTTAPDASAADAGSVE